MKDKVFIFSLILLIISGIMLTGCSGSGTDGTPELYSVSGVIKDEQGNDLKDVTLHFSGGYGKAVTDDNGKWSKSDLKGEVVITPAAEFYYFEPESKEVSGEEDEIEFTGKILKIVFASDRNGNNEIYTINYNGSELTNITNNPARDASPDWCRKKDKFAFTTNRDGQFNWEIYVMNTDGSSLERMTNNSAPYGDNKPRWSPNGTKIAFEVAEGQTSQIYTMNDDGTGRNLIYDQNKNSHNAYPDWSPDGERLTFVSTSSGNGIYKMNPDGTGIKKLIDNDNQPLWSPDGNEIVFTSSRDGNDVEIYVMNADGTGQRKLTDNSVGDMYPAWSPDGNKIVFSSCRDGDYDIYMMDKDGSGQTKVIDSGGEDMEPCCFY